MAKLAHSLCIGGCVGALTLTSLVPGVLAAARPSLGPAMPTQTPGGGQTARVQEAEAKREPTGLEQRVAELEKLVAAQAAAIALLKATAVPQGPMGPRGPQGPIGPAGPPGSAGADALVAGPSPGGSLSEIAADGAPAPGGGILRF